jgi:nucleotide-binding universal stress UspA family protein
MKSVLVAVEEHTLLPQVLETAFALGQAFESYIEGVPVTLDLPTAVPVDMAIGAPLVLDSESRREMVAASRHHFETFMKGRGLARAAGGLSGPSFGWHEGDLTNDTFFGAYARTFDIAVVGRPSSKANHPRLATAESALFESGRPILVVPPATVATFGTSVVIAWNRSTETARAVQLALPVLMRAGQVTVLSLEDWGVEGPAAEDLARSLRRHGIAAQCRTAPPGRNPGDAILKETAALGGDLLIKGAYTQSRLRQLIFGGATSHILAHASLPVVMAH